MKFLIIGLGSMGKRRARCLKTLKYKQIAGFDLRNDRRDEAEQKYGIKTFDNVEKDITQKTMNQQLSEQELEQKIASAKLENSYIGIAGKTIEPIVKPLGYDWKIGIGLIASFAAREVFVGTLATIYSVENNDEDTTTIKEKMASEMNPETGKSRFNFATGMSLLLFYAFAMQCMATLAIVKRETKSWKWPLIQLVGMGVLAYLSALGAYQFLS